MIKRPFCGMAISFLLGIVMAACENRTGYLLLVSVAVIYIMWLMRKGVRGTSAIRLRIGWCILLIFLGHWQYGQALERREAYLPLLSEGMQLTVQGEVSGKQFQNYQYIYELTSCMIGPYQENVTTEEAVPCNRIFAYSDSDIASIGEILVLNGTVELWESAANEGNFDAHSFYLAREIDYSLKDVRVYGVYGEESRWREWLFDLKMQLKEVYGSVLDEGTAGVLMTMVLGDKELLSAETKRLYQVGGLSHAMAISGLHISVIGMTIYKFLRNRGGGFVMSGFAAGILLCAYGVMVGAGISVKRSVGMFLLMLIAQIVGRTYDSLNALGGAALALLWDNPFLVQDAGFQFSFVAILGVVWVGGSVDFEKTPGGERWGKLFRSAAVQLTTLPLVVWHYFEIPLYSIVVNLIVLPMMGVLLSFGVAGGFVGLLSVKLAAVIFFPCRVILTFVSWVCGICDKLPQNMWIVGRPSLWRVVCFYVVLVLVTMWAYRRKRKVAQGWYQSAGDGEMAQNTAANSESVQSTERDEKQRGRMKCSARLDVLMIAGTFLIVLLLFPAPDYFELDFLDVGQGDAAFIRSEQGYTVFVDGGSTSMSKVGTYRILPFLKYNGVGRIDYWIVSHTDKDHISGLREILESDYEVGNLVLAEGIVQDEVYEELIAIAKENDTEVLYAKAGDTLHLGNAKLHVLYPQMKKDEINASAVDMQIGKAEVYSVARTETQDKNANSLVFLYEEKDFTGLFTGDIGSEQEQEVLAKIEDLITQGKLSDTDIDVYKAAHHGSKYSNSVELLDALKPDISVISCAKKNSYGHPHAETLERLEAAGSEIWNTAEGGQITVEVQNKVGNVDGIAAETSAERVDGSGLGTGIGVKKVEMEVRYWRKSD